MRKANALKKELSPIQSDWRGWCRLCGMDDSDENVEIYNQNDQQQWNSDLATAIGKYFWVNIKLGDELSNVLCKACHTLINELISFTEHVNKVQAMYNVLNMTQPKSSLEARAVREQYGLSPNNWSHIIRANHSSDEQTNAKEDEDNLFVKVNDTLNDEEVELLAEIEEEVAQEMLEHNSDYDEFSQTETNNDVQVADTHDASKHETNLKKSYHEVDETESLYHQEELLESDFTAEDDKESRSITQQSHRPPMAYDELNTDTDDGSMSSAPKRGKYDIEQYDDELGDDLDDDVDAKIDYARAKVTYVQSKYNCSKCYKSYKKPMAYKKHMLEEHNVEPNDLPDLQCKRCDRTFTTENQLLLHYRTHMSTKEKADNACPICDKKFTTAGQMRRHVEGTHESQRPYMCDTCGKSVKTLSALKEHQLVHTDECPFECNVCHRRFKNKARLKMHSDIHTDIDYVCNICGLKLNTKRTLNMHMLVHTEEKQFKCDICNAAFKRSKTLKAHLLLHTGLRPYVCNFCGKTFSNGSNCRMHKRKTHPTELAIEESEGKKTRTLTPHLKELVAATKDVMPPRKVVRNNTGLSQKMRNLLMAAEEREKRQAQLMQAEDATDANEVKIETCIEVVGDNTYEDVEEAEITEENNIVYEIVEEV